MALHAVFSLRAGDSRVEKQACFVCLNVDAVAVGAGLERESAHVQVQYTLWSTGTEMTAGAAILPDRGVIPIHGIADDCACGLGSLERL